MSEHPAGRSDTVSEVLTTDSFVKFIYRKFLYRPIHPPSRPSVDPSNSVMLFEIVCIRFQLSINLNVFEFVIDNRDTNLQLGTPTGLSP